MFDWVLFVYFQDCKMQKSDYGFGHICSQTFKQPSILEHLEMTNTAFIFNIMKVLHLKKQVFFRLHCN